MKIGFKVKPKVAVSIVGIAAISCRLFWLGPPKAWVTHWPEVFLLVVMAEIVAGLTWNNEGRVLPVISYFRMGGDFLALLLYPFTAFRTDGCWEMDNYEYPRLSRHEPETPSIVCFFPESRTEQ